MPYDGTNDVVIVKSIGALGAYGRLRGRGAYLLPPFPCRPFYLMTSFPSALPKHNFGSNSRYIRLHQTKPMYYNILFNSRNGRDHEFGEATVSRNVRVYRRRTVAAKPLVAGQDGSCAAVAE